MFRHFSVSLKFHHVFPQPHLMSAFRHTPVPSRHVSFSRSVPSRAASQSVHPHVQSSPVQSSPPSHPTPLFLIVRGPPPLGRLPPVFLSQILHLLSLVRHAGSGNIMKYRSYVETAVHAVVKSGRFLLWGSMGKCFFVGSDLNFVPEYMDNDDTYHVSFSSN